MFFSIDPLKLELNAENLFIELVPIIPEHRFNLPQVRLIYMEPNLYLKIIIVVSTKKCWKDLQNLTCMLNIIYRRFIYHSNTTSDVDVFVYQLFDVIYQCKRYANIKTIDIQGNKKERL